MTSRALGLATAATAAGLLGCGDATTVVAPVIDLPAPGSAADPLPSLQEVELSAAHAGATGALVAATFTRGEVLSLDGVPEADDLVIHLVGRSGGAEVGYGRTCRFAVATGDPPPTPHLWFTRTVHWAPAAAPPTARRLGGASWTTADQGVAFALGSDGGAAATAVEVFDPLTATWRQAAATAPRTGGVLVPLGDGRAVIAGGRDDAGDPIGVVEVVDPLAAEAARVETIDDPRLGLDGTAAVRQQDGDVIVLGGRDASGPIATGWVLEVGDDGVVAVPRTLDAALATPRSDHTLTRLGDDVGAPLVVIGGVDGAGAPVAAAELYLPLSKSFSTSFAATMVVPRHRHTAVRLPDGSVLVVGGVDAADQPVATIERFSIADGFTDVGTLPPAAGLVDASLTPLPDGRYLLSGGRTGPAEPAAASAYVIGLDPSDGSIDVTPTDDLDEPRAGHTAALLCDGTVLAIGGDGPDSADRYQPRSTDRR